MAVPRKKSKLLKTLNSQLFKAIDNVELTKRIQLKIKTLENEGKNKKTKN